MVDYRTDSRYQSSACVTTKTVLQQSSDLRVTIRDMRLAFALSQSLYDLAQTTETHVDCLELKQVLISHDVFFVYFFAACQIAKIKFAAHEHASCIWSVRFY